jgi:glycine dehydrogenase subunit 1
MRFMPHTEADVCAMLDTIGIDQIEDLIAHVPASLRATASIALAPGMSELEVADEMIALANQNRAADLVSFLGGGYYNHYVPAVVRAVISRAEFATATRPIRPKRVRGPRKRSSNFKLSSHRSPASKSPTPACMTAHPPRRRPS